MISPAEADTLIRSHAPVMPNESHALTAIAGKVLRQTVIAERDQPPFDRVAMDGIAIASKAWISGARTFPIGGVQAAGAAPLQLNDAQACIEVMTGAMLPLGCDCVIPVERIKVHDNAAHVESTLPIAAGLHIHKRASDCAKGQTLLKSGALLNAPEIAVIASAGLTHVQVTRMPHIAVISTGDELIEPGVPIDAWQIRRSNVYAVIASLQRHGYSEIYNDHVCDHENTLRARLREHLNNHDVLILSGGVSMGKFDFVPKILAELGVRQLFHKIAQRPGKPMWFGVHPDGKAVYALPGNPVSTLACMARYVLPGLACAIGAAQPTHFVQLAQSHALQATLATLLPVKIHFGTNSSEAFAAPQPTQGSGDFVSLLGSDGLVELPSGAEPLQGNSRVAFYRW